jgi:hypothetical protein
VLVIWLVIIFASFTLFASLNATVLAILSLSALSAAGAIFLVSELGQPFVGLMAISSGPVMPRIISTPKCPRPGVISAVDLSRQETYPT